VTDLPPESIEIFLAEEGERDIERRGREERESLVHNHTFG
jgi:hypothetical protein